MPLFALYLYKALQLSVGGHKILLILDAIVNYLTSSSTACLCREFRHADIIIIAILIWAATFPEARVLMLIL